MKVTVFGANGRVGQLVVAELLRRDQPVSAFVHTHSNLEAHPFLSSVADV
jgi:uncharacterized protein YbjT (DUF2867 family)